jgi:hypothetical protein
MAYRVNNRTVEIGVRMAVVARRGQLVWMVVHDSLLDINDIIALSAAPLIPSFSSSG